jgi:hypothetical protein
MSILHHMEREDWASHFKKEKHNRIELPWVFLPILLTTRYWICFFNKKAVAAGSPRVRPNLSDNDAASPFKIREKEGLKTKKII